MKVLVVDDSKLARLALIKVLSDMFDTQEIFQAQNGQEAVEIAKMENPSIVFLDLTMPIMDGYEALPLLLEQNPNISVVIVSADIQEKARNKVMELGAKLHVAKPIKAEKMQEILSKLRK